MRHGDNGLELLFKGLTALITFVGLAVFLSVIVTAYMKPESMPLQTIFNIGEGWLWNIGFLLIAFWMLGFAVKIISQKHGRCYSCGCGVHEEEEGFKDERNIVKTRYANGEITRRQYLEMIKDLEEFG